MKLNWRFLIIVLLVFFLGILSAFSSPCPPQSYSKTSNPDFNCPGPGELNDPPGSFANSIGVPLGSKVVIGGKTSAVSFDGLLLDKQRVIWLGLRIEALRKLRHLDLQKMSDLYVLKEDFVNKVFSEKLKSCESRSLQVKKRLQIEFDKGMARELEIRHLQAWYRSPVLWFAIGAVISAGAIFGGALAF
jgi:hypothetical protein